MSMADEATTRIGLAGCYDQRNYGDDLLAALFHKKLSSLTSQETIVFDCDEAIRRATNASGEYTWKNHYKTCSCVVFGGGGILGELFSGRLSWYSFYEYCRKVRNLRASRIPYAFVSVGAGPVRTRIGRQLIRYMVRGAEFVVARDQASYAFLQHFTRGGRLLLGTDYAFSMRADDIPVEVDTEVDRFLQGLPAPRLGVNLLAANGHDRPAVGRDLVAIIRDQILAAYRARKFRSIVLLLNAADYFEVKNAISFLDRLSLNSTNIKVFIHGDVWETTRLISRLDFLITMKLHFSLAAYVLKVPVACIGYHPKTERFFEQIGKLRYHESSAEYRSGSPLFERLFEEHGRYFDPETGCRGIDKEKLDLIDRKLADLVSSCAGRSD